MQYTLRIAEPSGELPLIMQRVTLMIRHNCPSDWGRWAAALLQVPFVAASRDLLPTSQPLQRSSLGIASKAPARAVRPRPPSQTYNPLSNICYAPASKRWPGQQTEAYQVYRHLLLCIHSDFSFRRNPISLKYRQ